MHFWEKLTKPIFILAPMEDVTDTVFRRIVISCGRPAVFFTEFTNVDGMLSEKGAPHVMQRLLFTKQEKPLVAQIWGTNPLHFQKAAEKIVKMGFDGIDINMGCPEKSVTKKGACSALINNPQLAKEIIEATKYGAQSASRRIPVSVKTRIGFKKMQTEEWISFLLEQNLPALTVHLRTAAEMSEVPAHWDEMEKIVKIRNSIHPKTLLFGNGDVKSLSEAKEKTKKYGIDGVMIGRGIFSNPWLFDQNKNLQTVTIKERLELLQKHTHLFVKTWGKTKNFQILKKYFKIYIQGFEGASELRAKLMETKNEEEVEKILNFSFSSSCF